MLLRLRHVFVAVHTIRCRRDVVSVQAKSRETAALRITDWMHTESQQYSGLDSQQQKEKLTEH